MLKSYCAVAIGTILLGDTVSPIGQQPIWMLFSAPSTTNSQMLTATEHQRDTSRPTSVTRTAPQKVARLHRSHHAIPASRQAEPKQVEPQKSVQAEKPIIKMLNGADAAPATPTITAKSNKPIVAAIAGPTTKNSANTKATASQLFAELLNPSAQRPTKPETPRGLRQEHVTKTVTPAGLNTRSASLYPIERRREAWQLKQFGAYKVDVWLDEDRYEQSEPEVATVDLEQLPGMISRRVTHKVNREAAKVRRLTPAAHGNPFSGSL